MGDSWHDGICGPQNLASLWHGDGGGVHKTVHEVCSGNISHQQLHIYLPACFDVLGFKNILSTAVLFILVVLIYHKHINSLWKCSVYLLVGLVNKAVQLLLWRISTQSALLVRNSFYFL